MRKGIAFCMTCMMIVSTLLISIPSEALDYEMDQDLGNVEASFWGKDSEDCSGYSVAGAGDVNGDGYDDILIGAPGGENSFTKASLTYLILGRASGWDMNTNLYASDASFLGEKAGDYSGCSVAGVGDVNGDGYDDILIGAWGNDDGGSESGQTYLILGKTSGWTMNTNLSASDASFWGEDAKDYSGYSVAGAGDVNGDGYDDLLIGAYYNDDGGNHSGQTYLILGKVSGWTMDTDLSSSDASFWGEYTSDYSGYSVAGAGDVNGDGYDDILIGAYGNDGGCSGAGQTYLIFGKASGWAMDTDLSASDASFWGEGVGDCSGYSIASARDVNGDGYDDILIGAYGNNDGGSNAGKTYLIFGRDYGWAKDTHLSASNASFRGGDGGDLLGISVADAGDVNEDGYDDILIGCKDIKDGGREAVHTYLILGRASDWSTDTELYTSNASFLGEYGQREYGQHYLLRESIASAGDVNMDGYNDILIGVSYDDDGGRNSGKTYLVLGRPSGWVKDTNLFESNASFWETVAEDRSGYSVAGAGDVNGDGYDDFLIGAPYNYSTGNKAGQTYLILGKADGLFMGADLSTSDASFWGENERDYSGISVASAGDVNGDGYDDILIGAYGNDDSGNYSGQTYLILGKASGWAMDTDLSVSDASFCGENVDDHSGYSVACAGDVNGDGYDDILIGAYYSTDGGIGSGQTYLILGKASGWSMDTDLSTSDASFWGENALAHSGCSVAGAGDVNGDGYDDILIGARNDADGGDFAGQTYLILGKGSGWTMDTDLSASDASFWGEDVQDYSGISVAGAGDVNGDGYDDILIGAYGDDDGGDTAGQTYLILGKTSGWAMDTDLSASDASFWGEDRYDSSGRSVAGAGDVNGDGYDDVLIGAPNNDNDNGWTGQTYLILGKTSGWAMDTDLSASDASFWGEDSRDYSGSSVAGAGDVNGDGYDDVLIGAYGNDEGGSDSGRTYLIFPDHNSLSIFFTSIKAYDDDEYSHEITYSDPDGKIYFELEGHDREDRRNIAQVWVKGSSDPGKRFRLKLYETGKNTGKFRGEITIANRTHKRHKWINASEGGWIEISSRKDPTILINLSIGPGRHILPRPTKIYLNEDGNYLQHFNTTGPNPESWTLNTNAQWLFWDDFNNNLFGTPTNLHVGTYWVDLHVEGMINSDEINFTIIVNNSLPKITTQNILSALQDQLYYVDYNSSDDQQGNITWYLVTNAIWLSMNNTTGILNGTPSNEDIGVYLVNVSVSDGNGGWDYSEFIFQVEDVNDPPVLYDANFNPSKGNTSTNFTFSIIYKDLDGDNPINISVVIDERWYAMIRKNSTQFDFKRRVQYYYTLNLAGGIHQYYYSVSDGTSKVRYPQNENLTTPFILLINENDTEKDSDGDGYNDTYESKMGSDPNDEKSTPLDWDGDGVKNTDDAFPDDGDRWEDPKIVDSAFWWRVGVVFMVVLVGVIVGVLLAKRRKGICEEGMKDGAVDELGRVGRDGGGEEVEKEEDG